MADAAEATEGELLPIEKTRQEIEHRRELKHKRGARTSKDRRDMKRYANGGAPATGPTITPQKWARFLGELSEGTGTEMALKRSGIPRALLRGAIKTDSVLKQQFEEAKLEVLRAKWDPEVVEDVCTGIALGQTVKQALAVAMFEDASTLPDKHVHNFYKLLLRDPEVKELYDEARMIQAEKMAIDDLIELADEKGDDETFEGRPNSAAVNRARLQVDTRKWIASKLHFKRFGDKLEQNVNQHIIVDHAARLEEARKRKEQLAKARDKAGTQ